MALNPQSGFWGLMTDLLMKKTLLATLLGASLVSTPLLAQPFVSFGLLNQKASTDWSHSQTDADGVPGSSFFSGESVSDTSVGFFIRGGYLLDQQHRLSLELARVGHDAQHNPGTASDTGPTSMSHDITSFTAHYDYLYPVMDQLNLFAGLHLGMVHSDLDTALGSDSDVGLQYGLQLGAAYQITPQWSVDLAYAYSMTSLENKATVGEDTIKVELDNLSALRLGVSYQF